MHYDLLSDRDLELLDTCRMEHFRASYPELAAAALFLMGDRTLVISGGASVLPLKNNVLEVTRRAYLLTAANAVMVYADGELVINSDCNILEIYSLGDRNMVVATESDIKPQIDELKDISNTKNVYHRAIALSDIAEDLEATTSDVRAFLEAEGVSLILFKSEIVVTETEANLAYEHYSLVRARQKKEARFAAIETAAPSLPSKSKNIASKTDKPKKPTLTFKREFKPNKSNYKRTIQNFLGAMFPDSPSDQEQALSDIVQQTETGLAYLDKIVKVGDYKDKQHSRDLLFKAADVLAKESDGDPKKEEIVETAV